LRGGVLPLFRVLCYIPKGGIKIPNDTITVENATPKHR
jgi:hypothetical protein